MKLERYSPITINWRKNKNIDKYIILFAKLIFVIPFVQKINIHKKFHNLLRLQKVYKNKTKERISIYIFLENYKLIFIFIILSMNKI